MMGTESSKRSAERLFWGSMSAMGLPERIASLTVVVVSIAALSFCQLGFWSLCIIDGKPVYLVLLLAPLVMGAFMFGPLTGALLGLYAGAVVFAHATFFPLDFYEVYFMTPLNTFVLLTVVGGVAGWLFSFVLRRNPKGASRAAMIALVCVVLSFATSGLMVANTFIVYGGVHNADTAIILKEFLINSPLGIVVQALVDALLIVALCLLADLVARDRIARGNNRSLRSMFSNWMFVVSCIVFMLSSAIVFTVTTVQAEQRATTEMLSEVDYLKTQMELPGNANYADLLDGYNVAHEGYVIITDEEGVILAADDERRYPEGADLIRLLGYDEAVYGDLSASTLLGDIVEDGGTAVLQATDEDGVRTMENIYAAVDAYSGGFVVMLRTPETVFANRLGSMTVMTFFAIILIAAIAVLATILLKRVVVRGIDETNESLGKITSGDLSERIGVHDSREFVSLSAGINTTVSALKDTIEEVRQRNAQELMTAKAIQESSLPTDFPAFPDIDTFDIYASMKTAKEVGGDFYDFFLVEGTTNVGFIMADVAGKGIPAALFMMTAKTQIRNYMEAGLPIGEAIDAANHQLCIGNDAGMFVTMYACLLDYETGHLSCVNAGHNPPLILHDGEWEWMRGVSGMPLGLFDGIPYEPIERQLEPGDMLYLYTDGVTEAMDADGNLFGEARLEETLGKYSSFNPRSACVGVRRAITDFTLDCEQSDDITMLGLKYGVPPETRAVMVLDAVDTQLVHVCNYIHAELHRRNAPKAVYNPIDIAAEELFVNVCHYAYPDATPDNPGEVRISFEYNPNPPSLTVQISDDGVPYNPLAKPDAVTPDDIADVPIGGLGILMAKNSVDDMTYERVNDGNVLTIVKQW